MWLKQSTAVVINFGPFVANTDGVTLVTTLVSALDHASTGILLSKNGGTLTIRHATVTATTYDAHGIYKVTLDTTDTATLGHLLVMWTAPATNMAVWRLFVVVPANVYDSLIAGSDLQQVDVTQLLNTAWLTPGVAGTPDVNVVSNTNPAGVKKNTALTAFTFFMADAADHVSGKTGLTVTAQRSIDGAAFGACANAVSEISAGLYKITLAAADLNGDVIALKFTGTGADQTTVIIVTEP